MLKSKTFAVDFDGTLCSNKYPQIGWENIVLINKLKDLKASGAKLILWTCRKDEFLDAAVHWCEERGLIFDAINENLPEYVEFFGGDTRKIYADIYIDDRAMLPFNPLLDLI